MGETTAMRVCGAAKRLPRSICPYRSRPGRLILIVVIGLNLFGDALRDALDVALKE